MPMKFLFDLFPVLLFFAVYSWAGKHTEKAQAIAEQYLSIFVGSPESIAEVAPILLATAIAILATIGQVLYLKIRQQKIEPMLWVSLAIIVVLGGATIYFGSEAFIKWKPTVLYWFFAVILILSPIVVKKNLIRLMIEKQLQLPDFVWTRLNYAWAVFFLMMGILNLYVAFWGGYSTSTWVNFKLFGGIGLMLLFVIGQSVYLSRYMKDKKAK